jgi:hypothetical protein
MMTKTAVKMVGLAIGVGAVGAAALAVPTKSARADSDRCSGMTQPLCATEEVCVGIDANKICHTDYYYFPGPQ